MKPLAKKPFKSPPFRELINVYSLSLKPRLNTLPNGFFGIEGTKTTFFGFL